MELPRDEVFEDILTLAIPKIKRTISRYTRVKLEYDNLVFNIINDTPYIFPISFTKKKQIKLNLVNLYEFV